MTFARTLSRTLVVSVCCLSLTLPTRAAAAEPEDEDESTSAGVEGGLSDRASEHVVKAIRAFNNGDYASAEGEFKRAEFFAPKWRAIHYNLAVVAEAQGKLGVAIREYEKFKPDATPDEDEVVNQRLFELNDRRKKIARSYRSQIVAGSAALAVGVAALAAGGLFIGLYVNNNNKIKELEQANMDLAKQVDEDGLTTPTAQGFIENNQSEIADREGNKLKLLYASAGFFIAGALIASYAAIPLSKAVKARRQLEGIAIGPTRLQWTGGMGARLRF